MNHQSHIRLAQRVALPMAEASQMEGRMKALLQRDKRRGGMARRTLALGTLTALALIVPLAVLRPVARAQTPGPQTNFEVRNNGKLVMLIHTDGGDHEATHTLMHVTLLFYRQDKVSSVSRMDSLRFKDVPGGKVAVMTHMQMVNAQGLAAGFMNGRFTIPGTVRQVDALTLEQVRAIQNVVPDAPPRIITPDAPRPTKQASPTKRIAPPQKYVAYDFTWAKVPGNPENAEAQMKRIYGWLTIYRQTHGGAYPKDLSALIGEMEFSPEDYGISEAEAKNPFDLFTNPDTRYTNMRAIGAHPIPYIMQTTRLDGTALGSPKAPGTRDVLAYTSMYVQQNWRKGIPTTQIGFYLVLWDDGTVERAPWNAILWVPYVPEDQRRATPVTAAFVSAAEKNRFAAWTFAFPGQAGVPANALTDAEYHHRRG